MNAGPEAAPAREVIYQDRAVRGPVNAWERLSFSCVRRVLRWHTRLWGLHGLYVACRAFGAVENLVNHKRRRRVGAMLDEVFEGRLDRRRRRRLIREHVMQQRCDKVFYLIADTLTDEQIHARFNIVNRHLLDDALAQGKGCYVMLCHLGAHYVAGLVMASMGYRVAGIRDPREGALQRYLAEMWERRHPDWPRPKVLYSFTFPREIYRLLQDNWALGSALDAARVRDAKLRTAEVRIFGQIRHFLTGTLQIALRCGAPVLQGFVVAEADFAYRLELLGPMADRDDGEETPEKLQGVLQRYADNIAEYARRYPEQVSRV
jgi:lauroyl/myristoyl acyltransferase